MVCIQCGGDTHVYNSRHQKRTNSVWRRRRCLNCGASFTSEEIAKYGDSWRVLARNGQLQPFSRDKLFLSLYGSLRHRPAAVAEAGALTDTVIVKLSDKAEGGRIEARFIIQTVSVALNRFDRPASVQYQAFHPL